MADTALKNAHALRAELLAHLQSVSERIAAAELERQHVVQNLSAVEDFIHLHEQYAALRFGSADQAEATADGGTLSPPPPPPPPSTQAKHRNPPHEVVAKAAMKIIETYGEPMKRELLHQCLTADGLHITGKDDLATLGTMLWRHKDEIVLIKGVGYWLADRDYEPAGYKALSSPQG